MKKVLALVLALTMIVGFASTAMASYTWNGLTYKYDLFKTNSNWIADLTKQTVGDLKYVDNMAVEGNKEYKVKVEFAESELNNFFDHTNTAYDQLAKEIRALEVIEEYNRLSANRAKEYAAWTLATDTLFTELVKVYGATADVAAMAGQSPLYKALVDTGKVFGEAYDSAAFQSAKATLLRDRDNMLNGYYGLGKGIAVTATSKDETYATITSPATISMKGTGAGAATYTVEFKVRFTNTTFKMADVDVELLMQAGSAVQGSYYEAKKTYKFDVYQAQARTFTAADAQIAFGVTPNVEISAKDYAYISADAFRVMLQNNARSLTVVNGMGNSKVRFDADSTNLPQDVFVGNFTTSGTASTAASISGFSSTTAAKIKIAVGQAFKNAAAGKTLSVYDANGNKLDVEATLQGDNTVNFFAPLSNYTVSTSDWAGQVTAPVTGDKVNPSMGGK